MLACCALLTSKQVFPQPPSPTTTSFFFASMCGLPGAAPMDVEGPWPGGAELRLLCVL